MQDYSKLYRKKYQRMSAREKLRRIERVCKQNLPPDTLLVLILAIVFPAQVLTMLKR